MTGAETYRFFGALVLVMVANMAPWASGRLMGGWLAMPLDFGATLPDGSRLLGDHKTWRGLLAGELSCAITAQLLGHSPLLGIQFATLSLAADAVSSFLKRRLGFGPGAEVPALDQVPEALIPLLFLADPLGISLLESVGITLIFLCLDIAASPLRHWQARSDR